MPGKYLYGGFQVRQLRKKPFLFQAQEDFAKTKQSDASVLSTGIPLNKHNNHLQARRSHRITFQGQPQLFRVDFTKVPM